MKTIIPFLFLMTISNFLKADCVGGVSIHPQNGSFYNNSKIIVTAYMMGLEIVRELDEKFPIYLKSGNHKVRLVKETIIEGERGVNQAVFHPETFLKKGQVYTMEVENLIGRDSFYRSYFNNKKRKNSCGDYEAINWLAIDDYDEEVPEQIGEPSLVNKNVKHFGCGSAIGATFELIANDKSEIFVFTELVEIETNKISSLFLPVKDGKVYVGSGMCSAAFTFNKESNYKVRFKVYDTCGNTNDNWTNWVEFESPIT